MTTTDPTTDADQLVASRTVNAPPQAVYALLTDPNRHQETEPGDWVRGAIDTDRLTEVGQIFGVEMYFKAFGDYEMHNRVIALEPDRVVAWEPGQRNAQGEVEFGGWTWRYELEPADAGTLVTLRYDWSATPQVVRDEIGGMPPFGIDFLHASLESLSQALDGGATPSASV